jgi:hypothetical protein
MPLPSARPRELLTRRTMTCEGYLRDDGLVDVEGHLVDARGYDTRNDWRGEVPRGQPAHEMWVRLTVDDRLMVTEAVAATDHSPYPMCRDTLPNLARLVGLSVAGGFKKQVRARIGATEGCTHVLALIDAMSNVAIHAIAGKRRGQGRDTMLGTYGTREGATHPLIGSCHSYAPDSPVVAKLWPQHYRPRSADDTQ